MKYETAASGHDSTPRHHANSLAVAQRSLIGYLQRAVNEIAFEKLIAAYFSYAAYLKGVTEEPTPFQVYPDLLTQDDRS